MEGAKKVAKYMVVELWFIKVNALLSAIHPSAVFFNTRLQILLKAIGNFQGLYIDGLSLGNTLNWQGSVPYDPPLSA